MEQKTFELIAGKVGETLSGEGFRREGGLLQEKEGKTALFLGDGVAYSVLYEEGKKRFALRICDLEDGRPNGSWKSLSVWLYDPESDTPAQAQSIADDFAETLAGPKQKAAIVQRKKKKKDDENNADPLFFFNRFVGLFPELRDELAQERSAYGSVRAVTFAREHLLPKINALLASAEKDRVARLAGLLNDLYVAGDMDVRSIITIVVLNGIESKGAAEMLRPLLSEELAKAHKAGLKLRGKKIKPEKKKKQKKFTADTLLNR